MPASSESFCASDNQQRLETDAMNGVSPRQLPHMVVHGDHIKTDGNVIEAVYDYHRNELERASNGVLHVHPKTHRYAFRTQLRPRRTGLMLVGLGGNNGSTVYGTIIANREKMSWRTREGVQEANYFGSVTQASTVHLGWDGSQQVHVPFGHILPMLNPNELPIDGWDINSANLGEAMQRARVFDPELQDKLRPFIGHVVPRPSIYYPDFIASNQESRANHLLPGADKQEHLERIRADIRDFKAKHSLEHVVVLWTANTERHVEVADGLNATADQVLASIKQSKDEVSPSNIFAVAAILEGASYINGSPQNTLVPGIVQLAQKHGVFVSGDDFKSGQTKFKSVFVDFLVKSGLKPESIVSWNHLGNNDGMNLSEQRQFRSKEISKSNVVDDMVASNEVLYPPHTKGPDHVVVIKYVPWVGDSKRAMDEYSASILMGGKQTVAVYNTCEDSLLAAPLILDLALLTELLGRISYTDGSTTNYSAADFASLQSVLSSLALLLKAPMVPSNTPVVNAFFKQLGHLTRLFTACAGISAETDLQLEFITKLPPALPSTNNNSTKI